MSSSSSRNEFIKDFLKDKGLPFKDVQYNILEGDGSKRHFMRIITSYSGPTFVFMENPPSNDYLRKENLSYLMIGKHLFKKDLPVPEIYRFDLAHGWFILEDMGDISLQDKILKNEDPTVGYEEVLDLLFRIQVEGAKDFNTQWCCQTERYDNFVMRRYETDYFRDSFLSNYLGIESDWSELEGPFDHLSKIASTDDNYYFMHRDFQSRNIMFTDNKLGVLDWQGGRLGPLSYDLASLLIDPYVSLSHNDRVQLYRQYLSLLKNYRKIRVESFERSFPYIAIQRNLQILGAFSFLTKTQGKKHFEKNIIPALDSLKLLLDELADPELSSLSELINSLKVGTPN